MTERIPDEFTDLFERRAFAHLATLMPDGTPHITPVWIDYDGEHLLVNTPRGTVKDRNMEARPQVAVSIQDPQNPYRYLAVRGEVVLSTEEGAQSHMDRLALRYTGQETYRGPSNQVRRIHRIAPVNVVGQAPPRFSGGDQTDAGEEHDTSSSFIK